MTTVQTANTGNYQADFQSADGIMSLFSFLNPSERNRRVFSAGELLNDDSTGSATHVRQQGRAQFNSRVEQRNEMVARRKAEDVVAAGGAPSAATSTGQLASFQIPTMIRV